MLPTGLWQNWAMFAPEPVRDTVAFEAVIQDRSGMLRSVPFPRTAELSVIEAIPKYRHAKFTAMIGAKESTAAREFTARHVARTAGLPDDAFPVTVQLYYHYWPSNPPGQGAMDPLGVEPRIKVLETYRFASLEDCQP
jgi:hypothetical protein